MENQEKENEIYDRQIRLWGLEAQRQIRSSKVFISGMGNLSAEVGKNLVLAGVGVTVQDSTIINDKDMGWRLLFNQSSVGKRKAEEAAAFLQELNTLVSVEWEERSLDELPEEYFAQFRVVCLCGSPRAQQIRINEICRRLGSCFYSTNSFGFDGVIFCDLAHHEYHQDNAQGDSAVKCSIDYCSLQRALESTWGSLVDRFGPPPKALILELVLQEFQAGFTKNPAEGSEEDFVRLKELAGFLLKKNGMAEDFLSGEDIRALQTSCTVQLVPVCAILGGVLGQEIIKAISMKGEPMNNFFVLSGLIGEGKVLKMPKN